MKSSELPIRFLFVLACLVASMLGCNRSDLPAVRVAPSKGPFRGSTFALVASAKASGIEFAYRNGSESALYTMVESLGGGVAAIDYDRDGRLDLCFAGGGSFPTEKTTAGRSVGMFRNLSDWQFAETTAPSRLDGAAYYNHGVIAGDYDADGFPDLLITGFGSLQLWRNRGDGTFTLNENEAALNDRSWSSSAAWGDFNSDGCLDLYVAHYVDWSFDKHPYCPGPQGKRDICPPREFGPLPDSFFISNGDGTFSDATSELGKQTMGKGLGVLAADLDVDGDLDIYVANDTDENFLYLNNGHAEFDEAALMRGVAVDDSGTPNGSMGVDICDFNSDGLPDVWVTNYEREAFALYRNEGNGQFLHVSQPTGVTALQGLFVGFGTVSADIDCDGDEDFLVTNGHVILYPQASPRRQVPIALENQGGRFHRVTGMSDSFFEKGHEGRGLASVDLDNDGDLDFAISHINEPVEVLRNDVAGNHWLGVRLVGTRSNRDAIGARLVLTTPEGTQHRQVRGGGSYLSTNEPRAFWGLGDVSTIDELRVFWPSGQVTTVSAPRVNQFITLIEPSLDDRGDPL